MHQLQCMWLLRPRLKTKCGRGTQFFPTIERNQQTSKPGKNFSGLKKLFFPIRCLHPKPSVFIVLCPFKIFEFRRSCAQRQPPSKRMCSFAAAVLCKATLPQGVTDCKQMCRAIGLRRDQHKPKLSTRRRARQTHQGDFRLTLVSQNQNAKPCSEIPSAWRMSA